MVLHLIVTCVFNNWINRFWLILSLFSYEGKKKIFAPSSAAIIIYFHKIYQNRANIPLKANLMV